MKNTETGPVVKGSLATIVLKLLEQNDRMYGYEITKVVREMTDNKMAITEAALYPALHKLLEEGLLETTTETVDGRRRKYYTLSKKGKTETADRVNALQEALISVQILLNTKLSHG
ncbi:MAG: PadR family transcriptional regulator [Sphingobacteriales bacterium]|nr:MAG: PadR family transcriptional regulator [Sphingobacteriales bacterium]